MAYPSYHPDVANRNPDVKKAYSDPHPFTGKGHQPIVPESEERSRKLYQKYADSAPELIPGNFENPAKELSGLSTPPDRDNDGLVSKGPVSQADMQLAVDQANTFDIQFSVIFNKDRRFFIRLYDGPPFPQPPNGWTGNERKDFDQIMRTHDKKFRLRERPLTDKGLKEEWDKRESAKQPENTTHVINHWRECEFTRPGTNNADSRELAKPLKEAQRNEFSPCSKPAPPAHITTDPRPAGPALALPPANLGKHRQGAHAYIGSSFSSATDPTYTIPVSVEPWSEIEKLPPEEHANEKLLWELTKGMNKPPIKVDSADYPALLPVKKSGGQEKPKLMDPGRLRPNNLPAMQTKSAKPVIGSGPPPLLPPLQQSTKQAPLPKSSIACPAIPAFKPQQQSLQKGSTMPKPLKFPQSPKPGPKIQPATAPYQQQHASKQSAPQKGSASKSPAKMAPRPQQMSSKQAAPTQPQQQVVTAEPSTAPGYNAAFPPLGGQPPAAPGSGNKKSKKGKASANPSGLVGKKGPGGG